VCILLVFLTCVRHDAWFWECKVCEVMLQNSSLNNSECEMKFQIRIFPRSVYRMMEYTGTRRCDYILIETNLHTKLTGL